MQSITYLRGRRMWLVRDLLVQGLASDAEFFYLVSEKVDSTERVGFAMAVVGDSAQDIKFADLIDWKGNNLPDEIKSPKVLISTRSQYNAFIVGNNTNTGFRIARDPSAPMPLNVDLFICEMGD